MPNLAKQQASNVPASWKTTTTAREAASAGTVPAKRTEKQPDSIWASSWGSVRWVRSRTGETQPVEAWSRPQDLGRWSWKRSSRREAPDIIFQEISSLHTHYMDNAKAAGRIQEKRGEVYTINILALVFFTTGLNKVAKEQTGLFIQIKHFIESSIDNHSWFGRIRLTPGGGALQ